MYVRRPFLGVLLAVSMVTASLSAVTVASAQEDLPLTPDQPSATYGSAVADAALVYLEIYYRVYVREPQMGVYLNDGFPFETVAQCTGWGVAANHVVTASHCIQVDVQAGTVPYDIIVGPATDWALGVGLYPGLTRAEVQNIGLTTWEIEGDSANSPPVREIYASYGVVTSGLQGQAGTSTARLVDNIPIDQGDVALVSIQDPAALASAPIPILEIAPGTPAVGSEILSLGYPGVVGAITTGQTQSPSIQDGRISAVSTARLGGYQVFEVSSTIDSGMSGGPTVNFAGQVVGVNSFGVIGDLDSFKFVSPADRFVGELLARSGVANEPSGTDVMYRQAVTQYLSGNYTAAIGLFDEILQRMPAHRRAQELRIEAVRLRDEVGDSIAPPDPTLAPPQTLAPQTATTLAPLVTAPSSSDDGGGGNTLALLLIGFGVIAAAAAMFAYVRSTRPKPASDLPELPELPVAGGASVDTSATAAGDSVHHPVTEELERLSALHQAGELTDEEFAEFKHQLFHDSAAES
jgi:serine protease Do